MILWPFTIMSLSRKLQRAPYRSWSEIPSGSVSLAPDPPTHLGGPRHDPPLIPNYRTSWDGGQAQHYPSPQHVYRANINTPSKWVTWWVSPTNLLLNNLLVSTCSQVSKTEPRQSQVRQTLVCIPQQLEYSFVVKHFRLRWLHSKTKHTGFTKQNWV